MDGGPVSIERILIWSVDPRAPTAYGQQCALLADALKAGGYDVAIGAMVSRAKDQGRPYHSMPVYDVKDGQHGATHLKAKIRRHRADLIGEVTGEGTRLGFWAPVDAFNVRSGGLPVLYRGMLKLAPRAVPIAMSRFGERLFLEDGFSPLYVPHMIDTDIFRPMDKTALREAHGIPADAFVITLCAANSDLVRKNFTGQFDAFGRAAQDNWLLLVHSDIQHPQTSTNSWDLDWLSHYYGIADKVRFADRDRYVNARYTPHDLAAWYSMGDLHTQCTMAEGFGIPLIEAQACGLPVVATDGSAMSELVAPGGWRICGEPFMSPLIRAEWVNPPRELIAGAYNQAFFTTVERYAAIRAQAREFALNYSIETVMAEHWLPALKALEDR
jgi:glycosyltransferase involved in cell wall biosynthesis